MTEETKNIEQNLDTSTADVVKPEKKYSESEVQAMIRERLAKEKSASKQALDDATNAKTSLEATLSTYESILSKQIEAKANALPEEFKVLFDKLSLTEKLEYLEKYPEKEETKESTPFPKTPQSNGGDIVKPNKAQKFRI